MFLSRVSTVYLASIATMTSFASAQSGLRKSTTTDSATQISAEPPLKHDSIFSSIFGSRNNKDNRHLTSSVHYSQMGIDIDGLSTQEFLGKTVAMSQDGLRVAFGATGGDGGRGHALVFDWDAVLEEWVQIGQDIVGSISVGLGFSMDMNADGSRIVLGAPETNDDDGIVQVFELDENNTWQVVGGTIIPQDKGGQAGVAVSMNSSGDRVAVGAPRANGYKGRVVIYQLVDGSWVRVGQNIDCTEYYSSYSGASISLDGAGDRIVIGGRLGSYYTGYVKVFDYDASSSLWVLNGYLSGKDYYDRFGNSVDISEDGNRIVIGAYTSDGQVLNRHDAGEFCIMEYNGSTWNMVGQQVIGTADGDQFGDSVSISGDGSIVAISSPGSDDASINSGKVIVYKYSADDDLWMKQDDLLGECSGDKLGEGGGAVALDHDGSHLAVGAQRGGSATYYSGMARVYESVAGEGDGTSGTTNNCQR